MVAKTKKSLQTLVNELHDAYLNGFLTYTPTFGLKMPSGEPSIFRIMFGQSVDETKQKMIGEYIVHSFEHISKVQLIKSSGPGHKREMFVVCSSPSTQQSDPANT